MRDIRIWGIFFLSVVTKTGWTQGSAAVLYRVSERLSPVASEALFIYDNPAFMYDRWDSSYIAISLSGGYSQESRARILQEGKGESGFGFQARSWYRLNEKARTWGRLNTEMGKDTMCNGMKLPIFGWFILM